MYAYIHAWHTQILYVISTACLYFVRLSKPKNASSHACCRRSTRLTLAYASCLLQEKAAFPLAYVTSLR
jgi:hypothetical protein